MSRKHLNRRLFPCVLRGLVGLMYLVVWEAVADNLVLVTNISQVVTPLKSAVQLVVPASFSAVVCGVDRQHKCLALRDETGLMWLETETLPAPVEVGARVVVEGTLIVGNGRAFLGNGPLLRPEMFQSVPEQVVQLYLPAGNVPFKLDFYPGLKRSALEVHYEQAGSAIPKPPPSALVHEVATLLPGMSYECYGRALKEQKSPQPVFAGTTNIFFANIEGQNPFAFIRFDWRIQISQAGIYRLRVWAEDGASLSIPGLGSCRIKACGYTNTVSSHSLRPGQAWNDRPEPEWLRTDGLVKQVGIAGDQMQLEVGAETGRIQVRLSEGDPAARPMLLNSRLRLTGLGYSVSSLQGTRLAGLLLVPSMAQVCILQVADSEWAAHPLSTISNLSELIKADGMSQPVHLRGAVAAVERGKSLLLQDETGQVEIQTSLAHDEDRGTAIEVLGMAKRDGTKVFLQYAAYRLDSGLDEATGGLSLTTIERIRRFKANDSALDYSVRFRGVVTLVFPEGNRAHVQGESEGVFVASAQAVAQPLQLGMLCEFEGRVSGITVSPLVTYHRCTVIGPGQLPEPQRPSWHQVVNGGCDSQYIEIQGMVLTAKNQDWTISMRGGEVSVHFVNRLSGDMHGYCNSMVRIRGVVGQRRDRKRQSQNAVIQANSLLDVTVDVPAPADLFEMATVPVSNLRLFDPNAELVRFAKVSGVVVYSGNGQECCLMDGKDGVSFRLRKPAAIQPGDQVEVVGLPENTGLGTTLRQASVRKTDHTQLPAARPLVLEEASSGAFEATLVQLQGVLINFQTTTSEAVYELSLGHRSVTARLERHPDENLEIPLGSLVQVTGAYSSQRSAGSARAGTMVAEVLLNTPGDVVILRRPPWWSLRHSLLVLGAMTFILGAAIIWIRALRHRVDLRTRQLREEIAGHQKTEANLNEQTRRLEGEIEERKRAQLEVERIHRELVEASRQAGQAEVAASVLHNVGNVLNSVNVSASLLTERLQGLRVASLAKAAELMHAHEGDLGQFFATDPKGQRLPQYFEQLALHMGREQRELLNELKGLGQNVEHIKEIVAMQQTYAKRFGVLEKTNLCELADNALKLQAAACARQTIGVVREYGQVPAVIIDKHKMLQILVNLLQNAVHACQESGLPERKLVVHIGSPSPGRLLLEVRDNGVGISPETMKHLFSHGFTTRKGGHGFGLHSAALVAKEMGGILTARSDGEGKGASFILELPIPTAQKSLISEGRRGESQIGAL